MRQSSARCAAGAAAATRGEGAPLKICTCGTGPTSAHEGSARLRSSTSRIVGLLCTRQSYASPRRPERRWEHMDPSAAGGSGWVVHARTGTVSVSLRSVDGCSAPCGATPAPPSDGADRSICTPPQPAFSGRRNAAASAGACAAVLLRRCHCGGITWHPQSHAAPCCEVCKLQQAYMAASMRFSGAPPITGSSVAVAARCPQVRSRLAH